MATSRPRTPDPDPDWSLSDEDVSPKSQPRSRRQTTSAAQKSDGPSSPVRPGEDEDEEGLDSGDEGEDEDDYYDDDDVSPKSIPRDRRKPKKVTQEQPKAATVNKEDQQQQTQTVHQRQELAPAPVIEQRHGPIVIGQAHELYHPPRQQNGIATQDYAEDLYTNDLPDPVPPLNLDKGADNDSEIESVASAQNNYRHTYSPASTPDHSSDESINLDQLSAVFSQKKPPSLEGARTPLSEEPPSPMQSRAQDTVLTGPLTHPNGAVMFPNLTESEQDFISREALGQAEDEIVADSDEFNTVGGSSARSDAGYESDGESTGSTSMDSSIRDYMYENGRRYHRFREGVYNFPNDDVEQEREDMKHAMVKLLCGQKLHFAPIGSYPQEILDMGTGTGIWAIESE